MIPSSRCLRQPDKTGQTRRRAQPRCRSYTTPRGTTQALYTCPPIVSDGTYAQCDGGICFTRPSEGQSFPGFDQPLGKNEIICSCPAASPAQARLGYQIPGPFPCQKSFFQNCKSKTANTNTGSTIYSGAPIGSARFLTHQLYGTDPSINQCPSPHD